MQQKKIIIFTIIMFVLSSAYLFYIQQRDSNPSYQKNWWALYFQNTKDNSTNFVIENHSDKTIFHWVILADKNKVDEGDADIQVGTTKELSFQAWERDSLAPGKIIITVTAGTDRKEIYKNFLTQ